MSANDAYDKLTPEEREARDKADRAREVAAQAGRALSDRQPHRIDSRFFSRQRCHTAGRSSSAMWT